MNRRQFLQQAAMTLGSAAATGWISGCSQHTRVAAESQASQGLDFTRIRILHDPHDPVASSAPGQWALGELHGALARRGCKVNDGITLVDAKAGEVVIIAGGADSPLVQPRLRMPEDQRKQLRKPESLALDIATVDQHPVILGCGGDERGLVYALTELADIATHADSAPHALRGVEPTVLRPANKVRGIMRLFSSDIEDKPWFNDRDFWREYLTMLAYNRFNRFNLALGLGYDFARNIRDGYFYFAYPFLVKVPGYDVLATNLSSEERDNNLKLLRFIGEQCAQRGLHFQLGIWTHAYQWANSENANHLIEGLTPETHAPYCRDALKTVLQSCPDVGGVTFRIHGESGVAEGSYDFWKTVFDGVVRSGRRVEIDLHAKGIDHRMIDIALATGMPVTVAPKSWAEHMGLAYHQAAIRPTEVPRPGRKDEGFFAKSSGSRSFMRYGYGDLMKDDRKFGVLHRTWPGTQRLLLWGDPELARGYGRVSSFCGSAGLELFDPLSFKGRQGSSLPGGRDAYADVLLKPRRDFEKYALGYCMWGRMLYNPDKPEPPAWNRQLQMDFGQGAEAAGTALAHASRILPLVTTAHCPSAANFNYWPEMYTNMPIVDASRPHPYGDTPSPKRFGTVSPLDPQLFSGIDEFAGELLKGELSGKYSPARVAKWLEQAAGEASRQLAEAKRHVADANSPVFRRLAIDVAIQAGLGQFFAWKFRAGVLYAIYAKTGDANALREALKAYHTARDAWANLSDTAKGVYVSDVTFGPPKHLRGHWSDRLAAIDQDIADMEKKGAANAISPTPDISQERIAEAIREVLSPAEMPHTTIHSEMPNRITPGEAMKIRLVVTDGQPPRSVQLFYRHVNEAETWQQTPMSSREENRAFEAQIPEDYVDSHYAVQWYGVVRFGPKWCAIYPGLNGTTDEPYFVLRHPR